MRKVNSCRHRRRGLFHLESISESVSKRIGFVVLPLHTLHTCIVREKSKTCNWDFFLRTPCVSINCLCHGRVPTHSDLRNPRDWRSDTEVNRAVRSSFLPFGENQPRFFLGGRGGDSLGPTFESEFLRDSSGINRRHNAPKGRGWRRRRRISGSEGGVIFFPPPTPIRTSRGDVDGRARNLKRDMPAFLSVNVGWGGGGGRKGAGGLDVFLSLIVLSPSTSNVSIIREGGRGKRDTRK